MVDIFGWILTRSANAAFKALADKLRLSPLQKAIDGAFDAWRKDLPAELRGVDEHAVLKSMFSPCGPELDPATSPKRLGLRSALEKGVPGEGLWVAALQEQWQAVRDNIGDEAHIFFRTPSDTVFPHLGTLAKALEHACLQDETLWRRTVYEVLVKDSAEERKATDLGSVRAGVNPVYASLVERMTRDLQLQRWDYVTDHAIRGLVHHQFFDDARQLAYAIASANWPGDDGQLEGHLRNVGARVTEFLDHFEKNCIASDAGDYLHEDKSWKQTWRDDYHQRVAASDQWRRRHCNLLVNLTFALTECAQAVRRSVDQNYFLTAGKFSIHDALGVTNEMNPIYIIPDRYVDVT